MERGRGTEIDGVKEEGKEREGVGQVLGAVGN